MADEKYNIKIEAGTDFVLPFVWTDDNGNPYNLTGATVTAQLREHSGDPDAFDFYCTHNGVGGRITLAMPNEVTKEIPFSYGVYDVRVTLESGVVKEPLYGDVRIQDEVTKPIDGTALYPVGISKYENLPTIGITNRLYFVYEDRKIYRWNGTNYVSTSVGNGIQRIDYLDGGTYRMVFDDGTYFDFESVPRPMGMHDDTQAYQKLDVVMGDNGASYIALIPVPVGTDITDADYWMQITPKTPTIGTVTDVAFDAGAEVTMAGTADAPVLNFKVPRGVTGNESIDDTKGEGDTDYVWSADKSAQYIYRSDNLLEQKIISNNTNLTTTIRNGVITINGTASNDGMIVISTPILLSPGTYYYGIMDPENLFQIQIRKTDASGTDIESLAYINSSNTKNHDSFTLTENTYVKMRLRTYTSPFNHYRLRAMIVKGYWPDHFIPATTAYDMELRELIDAEKWNLLDIINRTYSGQDVTLVCQNGKITINGTSSGIFRPAVSTYMDLSAGTYYFGARKCENTTDVAIQLRTIEDANIAQTNPGKFIKFTLEEATTAILRIYVHEGDVCNNLIFCPELLKNLTDVYPGYDYSLVDKLCRNELKEKELAFHSRFTERRVAFIGDSITSYNDERYYDASTITYNYYPAGDVDNVNKTWWMKVANTMGAESITNCSEAGSFVTDQRPDGTRKSFYERTQDLIALDRNPDLIFVALGTNDSLTSIALGEYDFDTDYTELSESTFREAYIKGIKNLQNSYPNANIICVIFKMGNDYSKSIKYIADILSLEWIVVQDYPIYSSVHPNYKGMIQISNSVLMENRDRAIILSDNPSTNDFNDFDFGYYLLNSATEYTNSPTDPVASHLLTITRGTYSLQYFFDDINYDIYLRRKSGSPATWKAWTKIYSYSDMSANNTILEYTDNVYTDTTPYTGNKLRVMSYNVAQYNNDTATYIPEDKRFNFKEMLNDLQPDIIGIQEDGTIDGVDKSSHDYIFAPLYPVEMGTGIVTIKSKMGYSKNYGIMKYSNGRWLRAAMYTINNKSLLFCSTHSGLTAEDRATQYEEMFKWVHGEITLDSVTTGNPVAADTWDYCIIAGDFNSATDEDKALLTELAEDRGFTMANGGYLGWLETRKNGRAIDNILCSPGVVLQKVTSYKSLYIDLYSDHYPLVADVILK